MIRLIKLPPFPTLAICSFLPQSNPSIIVRAHLPTLCNISVFLWSPGWKEYFNMGQATEKGKHFWPSCTIWFFAVSKFPFYVITCLCFLYLGIFIQHHPFHNEMMQVSLHGQRSCSVPLSLTHTKRTQCPDYVWILLKRLLAERGSQQESEPQLF